MSNNIALSVEELLATGTTGLELSDGQYPAQIVGYITEESEGVDKKTGKPYKTQGAVLVCQIKDDNGKVGHVKTPLYKASLHENSAFRKMLASWMKKNDPKSIVDALRDSKIINGNEFSFDGFIGKQPTVTIVMTPSKKDPNKLYANVSTLVPTKKDSAYTAVEAKYSVKSRNTVIGYKFADYITINEKEESTEVTTADTFPDVEAELDF